MNIINSSDAAGLSHLTYYLPIQLRSLPEAAAYLTEEYYSNNASVLIVMGGTALLKVNGAEQNIKAGSMLCCNSHTGLQLLEMQALWGILIEYSSLTLNHTTPQPLPGSCLVQPCSQRILAAAQELETAWQKSSEHPLRTHRLFLDLLEQIYLAEPDLSVVSQSDWFASIVEHIHQNYREELTREQVAALACVTPEHFSRVFHKNMGCTFSSYMNTLRIRDVQQRLLAGKQNSLQDLAISVGYKDGYYLSRKFKQVVGIAPMNFLSKPKRIITANYNYTAMLIALQVQPILGAYSAWLIEKQPLTPSDQGRELAWSSGYGSYKQVEELEPDVIIGYERLGTDKKLASLAPIVALPFMKLDWREQFCMVAEVAGKRLLAESWLEQYSRQVERANARLDSKLNGRGSVIVWEINRDVAYAYGNRYGRGGHVLYDDLGFHMPEQLDAKGIEIQGYMRTSIEQIPSYEADYIVVIKDAYAPVAERMMNSPRWQALKAVKRGRVVILNCFDLFYGFDPLSTEKQLELLVEGFTS